MRLDKNASIGGQPVKRIRDLLRRMETAHWSDQAIADFFRLDAAQANALAGDLVSRGFLQVSERPDHRRFYELGPQGPRLASARLLKPITRAKAESIVAAFLQRVEAINARPELLERVCEVRVFGSRRAQSLYCATRASPNSPSVSNSPAQSCGNRPAATSR